MTNPNIKFPITVPDDLPIMDDTQLINYVVEHTCDEMRPVMTALVCGNRDNEKALVSVVAQLKSLQHDLNDIEEGLEEIADAVGEINA